MPYTEDGDYYEEEPAQAEPEATSDDSDGSVYDPGQAALEGLYYTPSDLAGIPEEDRAGFEAYLRQSGYSPAPQGGLSLTGALAPGQVAAVDAEQPKYGDMGSGTSTIGTNPGTDLNLTGGSTLVNENGVAQDVRALQGDESTNSGSAYDISGLAERNKGDIAGMYRELVTNGYSEDEAAQLAQSLAGDYQIATNPDNPTYANPTVTGTPPANSGAPTGGGPLDAINKALGTNLTLADLLRGAGALTAGAWSAADFQKLQEKMDADNAARRDRFWDAAGGLIPSQFLNLPKRADGSANTTARPAGLQHRRPAGFAKGGKAGGLGAIQADPVIGKYIRGGKTGGQADDVPAMLSNNEYVMDADVVAALGDGNPDAGAAKLDKMRENVRRHKRSAPAHKIPPKAKSADSYLRSK